MRSNRERLVRRRMGCLSLLLTALPLLLRGSFPVQKHGRLLVLDRQTRPLSFQGPAQANLQRFLPVGEAFGREKESLQARIKGLTGQGLIQIGPPRLLLLSQRDLRHPLFHALAHLSGVLQGLVRKCACQAEIGYAGRCEMEPGSHTSRFWKQYTKGL